jgi:hypothetical protein
VFTSPHPCLARFLHRTIVALAITGSACFWPASTYADQLGVQSPGWDYRDPVNIAESRVYARLFFQFKDTGVITPEFKSFRFTNPAPTGVMTPFYGAEVVFKKIYAHRLQSWNPSTHMSYTLSDLRRDDPAVEAAFRLYATTGKLTTPLSGDSDVLIKHLQAIGDAVVSNSEFKFSGEQLFTVVDNRLESVGLITKRQTTFDTENWYVIDLGSEVLPPFPIPVEVPPEQFKRDIRHLLPVFPDGLPPYWPDNEIMCPDLNPGNGQNPTDKFCDDPGHPGFDCDDYARSYGAWLDRNLKYDYPEAEWMVLYVYSETKGGHALTVVYYDGNMYILDPQTGQIVGPISAGQSGNDLLFPEDVGPGLREIMIPYNWRPSDISDWELHPRDFEHPDEVAPWYTNPDVVDWWRRMFPGYNPNDFIWQ